MDDLAIDNFQDLVQLYRVAISADPVKCENLSWASSTKELRGHISWMLDNMPDEEMDPLKFHRCLGYVQCALMVLDEYSLDQLREHARRASGKH
jgi:hypothetical protein